MEGVLAVVTCFAADFAPRGWAFCSGQLLPISQNMALFSLLGTTFGGNGQTTFALPDMRGRTAISQGQGPGLSNYTLGEATGSETVTLTVNNMPSHTHNGTALFTLQADSNPGGDPAPDFNYPANFANAYAPAPTPGINMQPPTYTGAINAAGGGQPVPLLSPYLGMNYIICLQGIFPSRN
jgi:microcystin-dependent protein